MDGAHKNPLPILRRVFRGSPRPVRLAPGRPWHQELPNEPPKWPASLLGGSSVLPCARAILNDRPSQTPRSCGLFGLSRPGSATCSSFIEPEWPEGSTGKRWSYSATCIVTDLIKATVVLE